MYQETYENVVQVGSGTYGSVYYVRERETGDGAAAKYLRQEKDKVFHLGLELVGYRSRPGASGGDSAASADPICLRGATGERSSPTCSKPVTARSVCSSLR